MATGRAAILSLYRNLIREAKKWNSYNYRTYALRKIRHEFQVNKGVQDQKKITDLYTKGLDELQVIKRQVVIGSLYSTRPLVIEKDQPQAHTRAD